MNTALAAGAVTRGRRAAAPAPARGTLALFLAGIGDGWRAWARYRELSRLSDAELARLGLARGDVARHAVLGATGER